MNKAIVSAIVSCMLVVVGGVAGDLTVEGNLNVTSNLTALSLSATNAVVNSLVVSGIASFSGPIQGDGAGLTNLTAASMTPGSIRSEALASGAVVAASIAVGSVGTNKAVVAEWNSWGGARYMSLNGAPDLVLASPGRTVAGYGFNVTSISTSAYGAEQRGYNVGAQSIGAMARGATQNGYNSGILTIGFGAYGAEQRGYVAAGSSATNSGKGSIQLLNLTASQRALITGHASLGLGACRVTNNQSIVAGDGLASHGNGTVTAVGFYGEGSQLSGITAAQVGAYTINQADAAIASALSGFNPGSCVQTNHSGDVAINGTVSASSLMGNGAGITNLNLATYAGSNLTWDAVSNKLHAVAGGASYTDADALEAVTAGNLNMNANRVTGLADAVDGTDAVNRRTATNLVQAAIQNALQHIGPFGNLSMGQFTAQ